MTEYELEMAKKIAEVEGLDIATTYPAPNGSLLKVELMDTGQDYNPFGWLILGPLMVKYEVEINFMKNECFIIDVLHPGEALTRVRFYKEKDIPAAILLCIIESKE